MLLGACSLDGTPHISYVSQVRYLDRERVATWRQSFNRALARMDVSPFSQALVVRLATAEQFRLDLRYLHTTTEGKAFEAVRANLDAIASHPAPDSVLRLRSSTCTACCGAPGSRADRTSPSASRRPIRSCRWSSSRAGSSGRRATPRRRAS